MSIVGKWFGFGTDDGYDSGVRAFEAGRYQEAADFFETCLAGTKDSTLRRLARFFSVQSHAALGLDALEAGDVGKAEIAFRSALDLQPAYPDLHCLYARALAARGDVAGQERELRMAMEINPLYADAALRLGQLAYARGDRDAAVAMVATAVRVGKGVDVEAYRRFADAHQTGAYEEACTILSRLSVQPTPPAMQQAAAAAALVHARRYDDATHAYEAALALEPGYADVRCAYGQALLELDRIDDAVKQFECALAINPKYADAHAYLGVSLRRLGRLAESKDAFRRALACNPDHPIASLERTRLG